MDKKDTMLTKAIGEKEIDRRSRFVGGGLMAAFMAYAASPAYADEGSAAAAASGAAAAAESLSWDDVTSADAASASTSSAKGGLMAGRFSELGSGMQLQSTNPGTGADWNLANDEITDEILQPLADAEAENEQLRSDIEGLQALLTDAGNLPREVYYGSLSSGAQVDTTPAFWYNTDDAQLYIVTDD